MVLEILAQRPLRLMLGVAFVAHGYPKLSGESAKQAKNFMRTVGIPPIMTTLVGLLEFFGGMALALGLLTRVTGLLIALLMVGTTILLKMKLRKNYILGYELDLVYLAAALTLALLGGGPFSLDALLEIFG